MRENKNNPSRTKFCFSHLYRHAVPGIHCSMDTALSCCATLLCASVLRSHTTSFPSMAPLAPKLKSPLRPTVSTVSTCALSDPSTRPELALTRRAVLSSEPVRIRPGVDGWKSRHVTGPSWYGWPWNSCTHSPVLGAQTRSEPSADPVATLFPSGAKPPHETLPLCPANTCISAPSLAFHIHAVKSSEPARSTSPLGCHRTHSRPPPGPSNAAVLAPSDARQISARPSSPAVASRVPSLLNRTSDTESAWPVRGAEVVSVLSSRFRRCKNATSSPPPVAKRSPAAGDQCVAYTGARCDAAVAIASSDGGTTASPVSASRSSTSAAAGSSSSSSESDIGASSSSSRSATTSPWSSGMNTGAC